MLTSITIENFKAIRDPVTFELKPITLLFRPNSAGKSSILHALHYAREDFERHNLDAEQTLVGGKFIDLGGFRTLVHGHDVSRSVVLTFGLRLNPFIGFVRLIEVFDQISELVVGPVEEFYTSYSKVNVTVEIAHSAFHQRVYVRRYAVELDERLFAEIRHDPDQNVTALTKLDVSHPVLLRPRHFATTTATEEELTAIADLSGDLDRSVLETCLEEVRPLLPFTGDGSLPLEFQEDALPNFGGVLRFVSERSVSDDPAESLTTIHRQGLLEELAIGLTQMICDPGKHLRNLFMDICYLGPLRGNPAAQLCSRPLSRPRPLGQRVRGLGPDLHGL
jgi:hypothetical protein